MVNRILNRLFPSEAPPEPARSPAAAPRPAAAPVAPPRPLAAAPAPVEPQVGLVEYFTTDHHRCDEVWAEVEAASNGEDDVFLGAWSRFDASLRRHLQMEEEVLFPAFEGATGMAGGPTYMMRMEHTQMRAVLDEMGRLAAAGDRAGVMDQGDTLLMLIQQHNMKEEGLLYPMAENVVGHTWPPMRARLAKYP